MAELILLLFPADPPAEPTARADLAARFAAIRADQAHALDGKRVTLRVGRDSRAEGLDGEVAFDAAGDDDLHRTVRITGDDWLRVDRLPRRLVVEGRLRVVRHRGFVELRLTDARVVGPDAR